MTLPCSFSSGRERTTIVPGGTSTGFSVVCSLASSVLASSSACVVAGPVTTALVFELSRYHWPYAHSALAAVPALAALSSGVQPGNQVVSFLRNSGLRLAARSTASYSEIPVGEPPALEPPVTLASAGAGWPLGPITFGSQS